MRSASDQMIFEFPTVTWHLMGDEDNFFRWLYSIPGYVVCKGVGTVLYVTFSLKDVTKESAQELVALFLRYRIADLKQLRPMEESPVGNWFSDPGMYWHKLVFGE